MSKKNYEKSAGIALAFVLGVILIFTIIFPINVSAKTLVHEQSITANAFDAYKYKLNKIAARWPAKAVTQFFFS